MKIIDVIKKANSEIINARLFAKTCVAELIVGFIIAFTTIVVTIIPNLLIAYSVDVRIVSIVELLLFLLIGFIMIAFFYGMTIYVYKLSNKEEVKIKDIFYLAFSKIGLVIRVFFRVIFKFILQIIILIASSIAMVYSSMIVFMSMVDDYGGLIDVLGINTDIFEESVFHEYYHMVSEGGVEKFYMMLIVSFIVFIATSIYIYIKRLSYSVTDYIVYESNGETTKNILDKSKEIMKGKKFTYFGITVVPLILLFMCNIIFQNINPDLWVFQITFLIVNVVINTYEHILQVAFYKSVQE